MLAFAYFFVWIVYPPLTVLFAGNVWFRGRCVKGSHMHAVLDRRVVRWRPFIRPVAVWELALTVLEILQSGDPGYWWGLLIFVLCWKAGGWRKDKDGDDGWWNGLKGLAKRLRPAPPLQGAASRA